MYYKDGVTVKYDGDYAQDQPNGRGKMYYEDGTVKYDGDFKDNQFQGNKPRSEEQPNRLLLRVGSKSRVVRTRT
jgi:antitoxin component YwqK of YwqJK toxin-antitoxin module